MQDEDGRWVNFIRTWEGDPNRVGRTSVPGGEFWQARAMLALALAMPILGDSRIRGALERGMPHLVDNSAPSDVRSLHILTGIALSRDGGFGDLRPVVSTWCEELVDCSLDGVLMNSPMEQGEPHLWAHFQESALADASAFLERPDLLQAAKCSADQLFTVSISSGFDRVLTSPFDVATSYDAMTRLSRATVDKKYTSLAEQACSWFNGRNPAGQAVYDRKKGRVADGIDNARLNDNSGAESNIVGAQTLFDEVKVMAHELDVDDVRGPNWT
jgi:hypothetical protein